jgi:hypothetical protein
LYPELEDSFLVTVTEKRTKAEIDGLAEVLAARRDSASPRSAGRIAGAKV